MSRETNLLRAQLLIEAADLLDEESLNEGLFGNLFKKKQKIGAGNTESVPLTKNSQTGRIESKEYNPETGNYDGQSKPIGQKSMQDLSKTVPIRKNPNTGRLEHAENVKDQKTGKYSEQWR